MYKGKRRHGRVRRDKDALSFLEFFIITVAIILVFFFGVKCGFNLDTSDQKIPVYSDYDYKVVATMYGKDISNIFRTIGEVDTDKVGEYTIEYGFRFLRFLPNFERKVYVVDATPPSIIINGEPEIYLYDINRYKEEGFSAKDNYDGDLTEKVDTKLEMVSENRYELRYFCFDSSGNEGVAIRVIHINPSVGDVYLTFDDGPSSVTETILAILEEKEVKATFFITGFTERKENLIKKEYEAGHTIALHGLSHDYSEIYISSNAAVQNFDNLRVLLNENLGIDTWIVRFPGGSSNTISRNHCIGVMSKATQEALEKGYIYFDWNVDSQDAGGVYTAEEVYQNVIDGILPGRTNVVLMHDSEGHDFTAEALPKIIDWCLENGYAIKAINEDTHVVTHKVNN